MPYITYKDRTEILSHDDCLQNNRLGIGKAVGNACRNGGDFQYILAVAIQQYLENTGVRYQNCQDIMGALTGAQAEFIRCIVSPYEDQKITENGPVYDVEALMLSTY